MSVRLNFIVEGQTEETFVRNTLRPHLAAQSISASARVVTTSKKGDYSYRGGLTSYPQAKGEIELWMNEDRQQDSRFTTMFDLYALPKEFPGYDDAMRTDTPYERVKILETALADDIADSRFIPYIQLHEFETLLLADPENFESQFDHIHGRLQRLVKMTSQFSSPELIDEGAETAPSKRIISEIPEYAGWKATAGPIIADRIGLATLRSKCPHFGSWLEKLESLG